jgi:hypothetical protein
MKEELFFVFATRACGPPSNDAVFKQHYGASVVLFEAVNIPEEYEFQLSISMIFVDPPPLPPPPTSCQRALAIARSAPIAACRFKPASAAKYGLRIPI